MKIIIPHIFQTTIDGDLSDMNSLCQICSFRPLCGFVFTWDMFGSLGNGKEIIGYTVIGIDSSKAR